MAITLPSLFGAKNRDQIKPLPEESESDDYLAGFVQSEFRRRQQERHPFELQWRLNIAFMEGNQYTDINPERMALQEIPKLCWWQEREVVNILAPTIETRVSRLSRMRPILKCRPGTGEQADLHGAKVGTNLLKTTYVDEGVQNLTTELHAWIEMCGNGFLKHVWDPSKGRIVGKVLDYDEETGDTHEEEVREGDLDIVVVPPQEIYPDCSYRQNIENCRSIIHARAYHVDDIKEIWGVEVPSEDTAVMQLQRTMIGVGGLGYGVGGFYFNSIKLKDYALVKEYWELPTRRYPEGRLLVVAGGKMLHRGLLPYMVAQDAKPGLPFVKFDCIERPGVFWGRTVLERLIPLQRRYNALRNRKQEYLNRAAIGQYDVEADSIDVEEFEREGGAPGYVCVYKRNYNPPRPRDTAPLPPQFETEEQAILQELSLLSGVSELSRQSKAPVGVKSGVALAIALEQDETRLSHTVGNIEVALVEAGKQWLRMYKQFVTMERTLRLIGENNLIEMIDWAGSDITSDDVVVEAISAMIDSPAQRRQMVFDLLGSGLLNDPDTGRLSKEMRAKVFEMIELGHWETGAQDQSLHISRAERENMVMRQGQPLELAMYDDHIVHVQRHNRYRLTTEYEALIAEEPLIDLAFGMHVDAHLRLIAQGMGMNLPAPGQPAGTALPSAQTPAMAAAEGGGANAP